MNFKQKTISKIAFEVKDLSVSRGGRLILAVPQLQVHSNEVLMIIGPNGSGKTTLLLCLARLLKPDSGTISYKGVTSSETKSNLRLRRKFAVVFQEPLLLNDTVWNNVTLGLHLRGMDRSLISGRAQKWLERFGVAHLLTRNCKTLSGGEAKRVGLARAFALEPEVLFLDEPFNALDGPTHQALLEDFQSVLRETRVTTIMVTHDRNEAFSLADRIAVLLDGNIRQLGTPDELFGSPSDESVARFIESGNVFNAVVLEQALGVASLEVGPLRIVAVSDLVVGSKVSAYVPYEDIFISHISATPPPGLAQNSIRCKVVKAFPIGSQIKITLDCGLALAAIVTKRSWEETGLKVGDDVNAYIKPSSVHVILKGGNHQHDDPEI